MECASCRADLEPHDRYCPACRLPNLQGTRHPRFGPPEVEPPPLFAPRVVAKGARPCPRCHDGIRSRDNFCRSCGLDVSRLPAPPPTSNTVGVWTTPGPQGLDVYRPLTRRTQTLQLLVLAIALSGVGLAAVSLMLWRSLDGGSWPYVALPRPGLGWTTLQLWATRLAVLQVGMLVIASVLTIAWTGRAYRNLSGLEVHNRRLGPAWATLGWLVPVVNLVVPKAIFDSTWRASDPEPDRVDGSARRPVPTVNHLWWVCTLVALPTVALALVELASIGTEPPLDIAGVHATRAVFVLLAVAEILLVFAALLFVSTLGGIAERQRARALRLGPPAALARRQAGEPDPEGAVPEAALTEPSEPAGLLRPHVPPARVPALVHLVGGDTRAGRY